MNKVLSTINESNFKVNSVVLPQTDTSLLGQSPLYGTQQQHQTGKVIGFGENTNYRFGSGISGDQRKPIKLDSFGTVTYAHPGNDTILINETGKLLKVTENGLTELPMGTAARFVTGWMDYFALDANNHLWSWGSECGGILGHGDNEPISEPKLIEALNYKEIKHFSTYTDFVACVTTSGEVYFWGIYQ